MFARTPLVLCAAVVGASLAACSRPEPVTVELVRPQATAPRPEPTAQATQAAQAQPPPTSNEPVEPTPIPLGALEGSAPKLGAACAEGQRPFCGPSGRVAVTAYRFHQHRMRDDLPCKPVSTSGSTLTVERELVSACVAGDRLYVESTCIVCRISSGTVLEGNVSDMTPGQLAFVQRHAGLRGAPLRTAEAWERAITDAHAKGSKPNN